MSQMKNDIEKAWQAFEKEMIPAHVPDRVRYEMRRIYLYGAAQMWERLNAPSLLQMGAVHEGVRGEVLAFIEADQKDQGHPATS